MATCQTKSEAAERATAIKAELRELANEMTAHETLAAKSGSSAERFDELAGRGDALTAELKELERQFPQMYRTTGPNAVGKSSGRNMLDASNDYVRLHKLEGQQLDTGGFKSLGEFFAVLNSGRYDPRVLQAEMKVASGEGIQTQGGALVPEQFVASDLHPPVEGEIVGPRAAVFPMTASVLHVSGFKNISASGGTLYGGFTAEWVAEHGEFSDQTPKTSRIRLERKKLGLFTTASNELVSDSQFEMMLVPKLNQAIGYFRDAAFLTGDGSGKPKGVLNDVAIIEVAKEAGQAADTIVYENLTRMFARIHPAHIGNAVWVVNPTCIPQLLQLTITVGTGGEHVPVLNQSGESMTMLTRPVLLSSKLPVLGDAGDILLADFSQYAIGMARGVVVARSEHYRFQTDQTVWRAVFRADGQGMWEAPFTPQNGDTLSWCVKLAARA